MSKQYSPTPHAAITYPLIPSQLSTPTHITTALQHLIQTAVKPDPLAVSWVGAQDGLLARDVNGNGRIDNAAEL